MIIIHNLVKAMFLLDKETSSLVQVIELDALINPNKNEISAKGQAGEEEQPPEKYPKDRLIFPSGESLPRCWLDANYRNAK